MSTTYFFRHGQAGQRDDYDRLSETGREQARLLGEYLRREGMRFDRVVVGGLRRQRETAEIVLAELRAGGLEPGRVESDERWNEFDLDVVYAGIAPQLAADDTVFKAGYEEIERRMREGDGHIHREWTHADTLVVKAWIEGRYEIDGESWAQFVARVQAAGRDLAGANGATIAVFTSATPISIQVANALGSRNPLHVMRLAGAAINTNYSVIAWREGEPHLGCFNAVPHLADRAMRTFR